MSSCAGAVQAPDVSVAQPVEDQFDEFAGGSDFADVGAAAGADLVADPAQTAVLVGALAASSPRWEAT